VDNRQAGLRLCDKLESDGGWPAFSDMDQPTGGYRGFVYDGGGRLMQFTQALIGGAAVVAFLQFAVIEPAKRIVAPPPPPMVVHSISLADGIVTQDRSVNTDGRFTAIWTAEIRDAETGQMVPHCYGTGMWHYTPGRQAVEIPIREWVGNSLCELAPGQYQALATYEGGSFSTSARSPIVTVKEAE
jgi:hypothetical protein